MEQELENIVNSYFYNKWPSDHPIVYDLQNAIMTWNIEAPKQTGLLAYKYRGIKYFESNQAFSYRNDLIVDVLTRFCNVANFNIIFLQEVDTEVILNIIGNDYLYNKYKILFRTDPGKPKGLAVLIRNYSILSIDEDTLIGARNLNKNSIETTIYEYKGNTCYLEKISSQFPNSRHLDPIISETITEDGVITGKIEALKMILINNTSKIISLHICVHLNPNTDYGGRYSNLYLDWDDSVYIAGDFNNRTIPQPQAKGFLENLYIGYDNILKIETDGSMKINENSIQIGESNIYSLQSYYPPKQDNSRRENNFYYFQKLLRKLINGNSPNKNYNQIFETDAYRWAIFMFRLNLLNDFSEKLYLG